MSKQVSIQSFPISLELSDSLVGYLDQRPHGEVAGLVKGIREAYQTEVTRVKIQESLNKTTEGNSVKKETK